MREARGFTLIEILFAIFVGLILMGASYVAMTSGYQTSARVERGVAATQDVRAALQAMGLEIGMVSYNVNVLGGFWTDLPLLGSSTPVSCLPATNQPYKGIRVATPTTLVLEMDLNENRQVGDSPGEIVVYNYDMVNQYITRETPQCGNPRLNDASNLPAFLGEHPQAGQPRTVRVINNNLGNPSQNINNGAGAVAVFRYYNGVFDIANPLGTEIYPGTDPAVIPAIRRVEITLAVEADEVDPSTGARKQMIYNSSVLVRNHALSQ